VTYRQQVTSVSEHICNSPICNSNTEFELLWSFHCKKKDILDLTSFVSTGHSLHGRSSTGSTDSTGSSQDPEKDSSPQSTEHLRYNTSSSRETGRTENGQDYLVSGCHIACQEVSDFSNKFPPLKNTHSILRNVAIKPCSASLYRVLYTR